MTVVDYGYCNYLGISVNHKLIPVSTNVNTGDTNVPGLHPTFNTISCGQNICINIHYEIFACNNIFWAIPNKDTGKLFDEIVYKIPDKSNVRENVASNCFEGT